MSNRFRFSHHVGGFPCAINRNQLARAHISELLQRVVQYIDFLIHCIIGFVTFVYLLFSAWTCL